MEKESIGEDWQRWLHEWGDRFLLFARQQVATAAEAEDLVQDAFIEIWTQRNLLPRLEPGLFFTRIRRLAIDRARQQQRRIRREQAFVDSAGAGMFESSPSGTSLDLEEALASLPQEQREVLVLRIWADQTFEEIGTTIGISPNTAASRHRYGLEALRRLMMETAHAPRT